MSFQLLDYFFLKGGAYHGQLTFVGEQQLFDLGCRLRERYVNELKFLSQNYDPNEISVRRTNVKRCINSAKCLLAGLYLNSMHIDNNGKAIISFSRYAKCINIKTFSI